MTAILHAVFAPGFFASAPVHLALLTGGVAAFVSGAVGAFAVLRGQSYAGHALADISVTGGSGSYLVGISPLLGFAGIGVLAAAVMDMIGIRRPRGRDLATGIVRGAGLGLAALFLFWDTTHTSTTGAAVTVLFGSMFTLSPAVVPLVIACAVVALAIIVILARPLLLSSVSPDLAAARGVGVRAVGLLCLIAIALAVSLSALTIGTILSTALLVGPAATAMRLTRRPGRAAVGAAFLGVAVTWAGIVLAYDSFTWPPSHDGWPVSFFVVALTLVCYVLAQLAPQRRRRPAGRVTTVPVATVPASTVLAAAAPARTVPASTAPARTAPARTAPARTAPASTAPASTDPATAGPVTTAPAEAGRAGAAEFRMGE
jgi:zinc/manganese transport system permease protein